MENLYKYSIGILLGAGIGFYSAKSIHESDLEKCQSDIVDFQIKVKDLNIKLESANDVYELLEKKERLLSKKNRTIKSEQELSKEKDELIIDLMKIKDDYDTKKIKLDSLNKSLPNREGEDLINSISVKTQI